MQATSKPGSVKWMDRADKPVRLIVAWALSLMVAVVPTIFVYPSVSLTVIRSPGGALLMVGIAASALTTVIRMFIIRNRPNGYHALLVLFYVVIMLAAAGVYARYSNSTGDQRSGNLAAQRNIVGGAVGERPSFEVTNDGQEDRSGSSLLFLLLVLVLFFDQVLLASKDGRAADDPLSGEPSNDAQLGTGPASGAVAASTVGAEWNTKVALNSGAEMNDNDVGNEGGGDGNLGSRQPTADQLTMDKRHGAPIEQPDGWGGQNDD